MKRAGIPEGIKEIQVYHMNSGLGGIFNVSILEERPDETVKVRIWYGKPTSKGWEPWKEWDGTVWIVLKTKLFNPHILQLYRTEGED